MTPTAPLPCQRDLFDIPAEVAYLNCSYLAPQLRSVSDAGREAVGRKEAPWSISAPDFFAGTEALRTRVARLTGGDADGVALIPSVSYGAGIAAANLKLGAGQEVLVLEDEFPSNRYPWEPAAAAAGARIVTVPRPADHDWTAALLERIGEATGVVAVPNCHWTDGGLVDLVRVGEAARASGAALVVDVSQSLGARPVDVAAVQPDVLISVGYKWLLGPYALGYCWIAPQHRGGLPLEQTWLGRAGSEDFTRLVGYTDQYRPGARRFDVGEASNFVLVPMALAALDQVLAWGVEAIAATIAPLAGRIAADAEALGVAVAPAHLRAGHMLGLRLPAGAGPAVAEALAAERVHVSLRGDSLRISPNVYNTAEDLDRLRDVLAAHL
jgi:selenocysteine lyase/cysteine desulfurase